MNPAQAAQYLIDHASEVFARINTFTARVFKTRGGRMGSGMGALLESLWGYYMNEVMSEDGTKPQIEIAWLEDNEYNDFACIRRDLEWDAATRAGELMRVEAKSMNMGADESKAHFDELRRNLSSHDLLLVLVWEWTKADDGIRVVPVVRDYFIAVAGGVADLRDELHTARGGTFVVDGHCPDGCTVSPCSHVGEPLNASGKRERKTGPETTRPSKNVSFAANFGGLVRMLKTNSAGARATFRTKRCDSDIADAYITFVHRNFPDEERNQYLSAEWEKLGAELEIKSGLSLTELIKEIEVRDPKYRTRLRALS